MANVVPFQMLFEIDDRDKLTQGLVLPPVFRSRLSPNYRSIKLINCQGREYVVCVKRRNVDNKYVLCLGDWPRFVNEMVYHTCKRLCLRLNGVNRINIMCFDEDGVEYIEGNDGKIIMNRCIVKASYETFAKEFVPDEFISHLNVVLLGRESRPKFPPKSCIRIVGSRQHGYVKVVYKWEHETTKWIACGFEGPIWTNICYMNNVEAGYSLMFCKSYNTVKKEVQLSLDVFNYANVGLGLSGEESDEEFMEFVSDEECEVLNDPQDIDFSHYCRVPLHNHKIGKPYFHCKLKQSNLTQSEMTIEKSLVEEYDLSQYSMAIIHFGKLEYEAKMKTKVDKRVSGSQSHVVMKYDWSRFAEDLGIVEGDVIRFQPNLKKCVAGVSVDFDVC